MRRFVDAWYEMGSVGFVVRDNWCDMRCVR